MTACLFTSLKLGAIYMARTILVRRNHLLATSNCSKRCDCAPTNFFFQCQSIFNTAFIASRTQRSPLVPVDVRRLRHSVTQIFQNPTYNACHCHAAVTTRSAHESKMELLCLCIWVVHQITLQNTKRIKTSLAAKKFM